MKQALTPVTAADVRAARARAKVPIFKLAARLDVHSTKLGQMLLGNRPMPPELAQRVLQAIEDFKA